MSYECKTHHNACACQEAEHLYQIEKRDSEIKCLRDAIRSLESLVKRYIPDYNEHSEIHKATDALEKLGYDRGYKRNENNEGDHVCN